MAGLKHACGFLQSRVAARLQTRFTPALTFKNDDSVKKSIAISQLIDTAIADDRRFDSSAPLPSEDLEADDIDPNDVDPTDPQPDHR